MPEIDDRQCVIDIETLTFKPAHGEQLQTARRGKRFIPENLRSQWTGKVKDTELNTEGGDADITIDNSPYNEWLAAQGLLNLCKDQPKEGYIHNLHGDLKKDKGKSDDHKHEEDKQIVDLTKEQSEGEKSIDNTDEINQGKANLNKDDSMEKNTITEVENQNIRKTVKNIKKPLTMKRQQYVKGKLSVKTHRFVKTKSNKVVRQQAVQQKKSSSVEESKETDIKEENRMASIRADVQSMIEKGNIEESVKQTVQRKETLENILSMLNNQSKGEEKTKNICKIDKPNTSAVVDSNLTEKTVKLKVLVEDTDDDLNVKEQAKKTVSSDEFSASDCSLKNIQYDISKLLEKDVEDSGAKGTKKSVTFEMSTCAQLDTSAEEHLGDDTLSVNDLVIDEKNDDTVVVDVLNEIVETVVEAVDSGDPVDDCPSDELSCTPPCSQIPRKDPYTSKRFIFFKIFHVIYVYLLTLDYMYMYILAIFEL